MKSSNLIRLSVFLFAFLILSLWEIFRNRKDLTDSKARRWMDNIFVVILNTLAGRIIYTAGPAAVAVFVSNEKIGLLNYINIEQSFNIVISVLLLDLIIYFQHFVFHAFPFFWRFHMFHHADKDIDLTTALRFHPVEIIFSILIKSASVFIFGISFESVFIFEIILNTSAMFNHANIYLPLTVDNILRWIIVTPDMHRVHHSVLIRETNSNFGFFISLWDRIFSTYIDQPYRGHEKMVIGLSHIRDVGKINFLSQLLIPFSNKSGMYPFNKIGRIPGKKEGHL